jgi:hypothetical protein
MQCLNPICQKPLDEEDVNSALFTECECGTKQALTSEGMTLVDDEMPLDEYLGG